MRTVFLPLATLVAVLVFTTPTHAQKLKKSTFKGTIFSDTVSLVGNEEKPFGWGPLAGTKGGFLIITQYCADAGPVEVRTNAGNPDTMPLPRFSSDCVTWKFGYVVPADQNISCVNLGSTAVRCAITGVVVAK